MHVKARAASLQLSAAIKDALRQLACANWHVHTVFSPCAAPYMTVERIVAAADALGLKTIAFTDHNHPGDQNLAGNCEALKAALAQLPPHRVRVVVGAELSAFDFNTYSDYNGECRQLDFRLYACNHYHLRRWGHPPEKSPLSYKEHALAMTLSLIASRRADCVAHPLVASYLDQVLHPPTLLTSAYTDADLCGVFEAAKRCNVALEINTRHLLADLDFARRFLVLGFDIGPAFYLGTDAHTITELDPRPQVEKLIHALA